MDIQALVSAQRAYFRTGATLDLTFRQQALDTLEDALRAREGALLDALKADLGKSAGEGYLCEVGLTRSELSYVKKHFRRWAKAKGVATPMSLFPGKSFTLPRPYGVSLIMAPWNYPILLSLEPLIGAIAAGNCCILKPSAYAPAASAALRELVEACFPPEYVAVVEGGRAENQALLEQHFDYIFFTGGVEVGKLVMEKAAKHLTPVTLELGGKSPCVVDATARLDLAARRIVFGKLLNCGQTCVAPDYLLIDRRVKDAFLERAEHWVRRLYGKNALDNQGYVHMINEKHFHRVCSLIDPGKVVFGGGWDEDTLRIQPTILDNVSPEDPVMQEEIFGPVLPVLPFDRLEEAEDFILDRPRPLALYLFSQDKAVQRRFVERVPFGGGCINDTILHLTNPRLPFGGVGNSGMGRYHGKYSFDTFSHVKGVLQSSSRVDLPVRYPPYTPEKMKLVRRFLK